MFFGYLEVFIKHEFIINLFKTSNLSQTFKLKMKYIIIQINDVLINLKFNNILVM